MIGHKSWQHSCYMSCLREYTAAILVSIIARRINSGSDRYKKKPTFEVEYMLWFLCYNNPSVGFFCSVLLCDARHWERSTWWAHSQAKFIRSPNPHPCNPGQKYSSQPIAPWFFIVFRRKYIFSVLMFLVKKILGLYFSLAKKVPPPPPLRCLLP